MSARPGPHVPADAAKVLAAHSAFLDDVLDAYFAWTDAYSWEPTEASPWAVERGMMQKHYGPAGSWDDFHSGNLLGVPSTLLALSSQYLEAIKALLDAHQVIVSLPPLVRSTFEASCRIAWLLAPLKPADAPKSRSAARPRAARAALVQLEDFTRAKTAALSLGDRRAPKFGAAVRQLRRKDIPGWFYESEIDRQRNGTFIICGQKLPGFSQGALEYEKTFGEKWHAAGAYDFLSNASHPTPHMTMYVTRSTGSGLRRFEIENTAYISRLVRLAVVSFLQAWRLTSTYLGLPADEILALLVRAETLPE